MSNDFAMKFAKITLVTMAIIWALFIWKFVEIQRWSCTHIMNCGCGEGYKAIYHGVHKAITCSLKESK